MVYRPPLVDAAGHVQVDVLTSALPAGAATLAEQQTQTTALQLIDDLRAALAAVAGDQLRTDVITSALPAGAATLAEQQAQTTALQLLDDLRAALADVAADELRVNVVTPYKPAAVVGFQTTVTVAGTRVQLPNQAVSAVVIRANAGNAGNIYVGAANVSSILSYILAARDTVSVAIDNTNRIWIDAATSGDGVSSLLVI